MKARGGRESKTEGRWKRMEIKRVEGLKEMQGDNCGWNPWVSFVCLSHTSARCLSAVMTRVSRDGFVLFSLAVDCKWRGLESRE